MSTLPFAHALEQAELLARQALPTGQHERLSCAVALVKAGQVFQRDDHTWQVTSQSDPDKQYHLNGAGCPCEDAYYRAPQGQCKHVLATLLARKTLKLMQQGPAVPLPVALEPAPAPAPVAGVGIDPRSVVHIQGQPFVRFAGLLALASQRGLVALETTAVQVSEVLAVCAWTARFADGRVFCDIGDATEHNVKAHLRPHFIRMAATRASARALRRALNIEAVAVEELADEAA